MKFIKKALIVIVIALPLIFSLPLTAAGQQAKDKGTQKKEEKKKDTSAPQQATGDKKATESDLKAPEESMESVQDMTGGPAEVWNPENRRDPFASLIQKVTKSGAEEYKVLTREGKRPDGIEGMELKDINLVGIFFIKGVYKAMFVGNDDYPYLLTAGSQIWDGRIKEIDFSCVTFEQETEDLRFLVRRMKPVKRCLETE